MATEKTKKKQNDHKKAGRGKAAGRKPSAGKYCSPDSAFASIRDPKAPKPGEPRPSRGVGSASATSHEKLLTCGNRTLNRNAWARALGISRGTLAYRLKHHPPEMALSPDFHKLAMRKLRDEGFWDEPIKVTPEGRERQRQNALTGKAMRASMAKAKRYTAFGETHTLSEWSAKTGVEWHTLYLRLQRGRTTEEAFGGYDKRYTAGGAWSEVPPPRERLERPTKPISGGMGKGGGGASAPSKASAPSAGKPSAKPKSGKAKGKPVAKPKRR